MDQERSVHASGQYVGSREASTGKPHGWRQGENRLTLEMPLGVVRGQLDEPGPRFVDVEGEADKEACRLERANKL